MHDLRLCRVSLQACRVPILRAKHHQWHNYIHAIRYDGRRTGDRDSGELHHGGGTPNPLPAYAVRVQLAIVARAVLVSVRVEPERINEPVID